ncbi:MAG: SDR family oxidoreductase, partial [Actinocatenispora sp.]
HRSGAQHARQLADECGGVALPADLTVESDVDELVAAALSGLGGLDILVANAGKYPTQPATLWDMEYQRWRSTMAANLDSVFLTCRAFLRHVVTTGTGTIVVTGSTAGWFGEAEHADYAAAKAALHGLVRSLKNELVRIAPTGRINLVAPGWTVTARNANMVTDEFVRRRTSTMALPKVGRPEDVARVVVMLASDRVSGHVTGETVTVAGGMEGRLLRDPG